MSVVENTPRRLVLRSGSTVLTLDKDADEATLQRIFLFWNLKPARTPLSHITAVTVDKAVDRASGVEMFSTMLITQAGAGWALSAADKDSAERSAATIRGFLRL
jgi:hypothetical protein